MQPIKQHAISNTKLKIIIGTYFIQEIQTISMICNAQKFLKWLITNWCYCSFGYILHDVPYLFCNPSLTMCFLIILMIGLLYHEVISWCAYNIHYTRLKLCMQNNSNNSNKIRKYSNSNIYLIKKLCKYLQGKSISTFLTTFLKTLGVLVKGKDVFELSNFMNPKLLTCWSLWTKFVLRWILWFIYNTTRVHKLH